MMTKRLQIRRYFALGTALMLNTAAFPWLSMTSYAADYTTQQQVAQITEYSSQQVATLGQWETQADATVKFKTYTGEYLTNAWLQDPSDSNVWYYIDEAGNRYTGLITDNSTGKTYLLGETDGKMITADGTYTIQGSQKSLSFNQIHDGTFGALSEGSLTELRRSNISEKTVDHVGGSSDNSGNTTQTTGTSSSTSSSSRDDIIRQINEAQSSMGVRAGDASNTTVDIEIANNVNLQH
ncbi:MAG: hypothetical protein LIO81_02660 [Clostridiales bacterium]|nr:hypothetical protein [Clostridiales bacterium]